MSNTEHTELTEAQIREIARKEARDVAGLEVDDDETGEKWSVRRFISEFDLSRREALQAIGLVSIGVGAREAVARIFIQNAEAAPQDDLTVPGTLDAGTVSTEEHSITKLAVEVKKTTSQSVSADTDTKVTFDNTVDNDGSQWDGANNSFSPYRDGDYSVFFGVQFQNISDQQDLILKVYKNGAEEKRPARFGASGTNAHIATGVAGLPSLTTSDTIEFYVRSVGSSADIAGIPKATQAVIYREG
jgi:hypothetical protein